MSIHEAVGLEALDTDPKKGYIAVDMDGTLAHYDKFEGWDKIGAPIPEMVNRIKGWLARGIEVKILTARISQVSVSLTPNLTREQVVSVIKAWCRQHIGVELDVISEKDAFMICLFDDSVVQVEANTGNVLGSIEPFNNRIIEAANKNATSVPVVEEIELPTDRNVADNKVLIANAKFDAICEGLMLSGFKYAKKPSDWRGCQCVINCSNDTGELPTQYHFNTGTVRINDIETTVIIASFQLSGEMRWRRFAARLDNLNMRDFGAVIGAIVLNTKVN